MHNSHCKIFVACVILLLIVSFAWLTAHVFENYPHHGQYQQRYADSVLFARLFEQSLLTGKISETDRYGCFPYEIRTGFAPFYMHFLVHTTWLFYTIFPGCSYDPVMVAGTLPIIFVWFTGVMILFVLWRLSKNFVLLLLSAFFMLPGQAAAMTSGLIKLDYDFLISFFIWSWLLACALYTRKPGNYLKIASGLVVALFLATWSGTPFFFFFATIYGFYTWLAKLDYFEDYLAYASASMLIGGILNLIYIFSSSRVFEAISLGKYSYFQPLCIVTGGLLLLALKFLQRFKNPRVIGIVMLLVIASGICLCFYEQIMQSSGVLLRKDPVHIKVPELAPAVNFSELTNIGKVVSGLTVFFGWPIFLFPFFILVKPKGFSGSEGRFLRDWLVIMILVSIHQVRFLRWPGIGLGLYSGIAVYSLWETVKLKLSRFRWRNLELILIFLPLFIFFLSMNYMAIASGQSITDHQADIFNWIATHTPETSGYADDKIPEYCILTNRNEGNLLSYYSRRPVPANTALWGFKTMADIFSSTNEDEAVSLCQESGVKYIFMNTYCQFDDNFWPYFKNQPKGPEYQLIYQDIPFYQDFKNWFYFWLLDHLALTPRGNFVVGTRFRVVFASQADKQTLPPYFLFERVEGARLNIAVDPDSELSISIEVKFSEHQFIYKVKKKADNNGMVSLILPYSTSHCGGRVVTDPFYKLSYQRNGKHAKAKLQIQDTDVVKGLEIDLNAALEELPGE